MSGTSSAPVLEARELGFTYSVKLAPVISGFTHAFMPGTLTTLTGESGCGKSTLLYVLAGMLKPSSGEVRAQGGPFSALSDAQRSSIRAARVGFVFQDAMLDPARTVIDNVCESAVFTGMNRKTAKKRGLELLERFGVANRHDHRPGEISGGQAQRVALCRALLTGPTLIFADEPTGNLDPASAQVVWEALRGQARDGCCVVVATHSPQLAEDGDERIQLAVQGAR
ncbi:MAG: ABC transporter ATP-binding protein [Propionibacteriaceae bacterium]|jgi:ABC-type lipoprotein export system ATPase subunit|nr:ABC transporter ATP-binding protein [Propionibacteriaceae bacterium]